MNFNSQHRRSGLDRRTLEERRQVFSLDYFNANGEERRGRSERRNRGETRDGWVRVNKWTSVFVGAELKSV